MTGIVIKALTPDAFSRWDEFVRHHPEATFFHLSTWQTVIQRAFDHPCLFLYAERAGEIEGILPLVQVKSWLFGNSLSSSPFCVYGGIVATTQDAQEALQSKALEVARERKVDVLEMRNLYPQTAADAVEKDLYVTFIKRVEADHEANMLAIPRKQRAMIRKAIKFGLKRQIDSGVERFFDMYASSVRNLGTPVFAKRYFEILLEEFKDAVDILTIEKPDGQAVSSVMSFYFRDQVLPYYGGGTAEARELAANDFMYWDLMCHAVDKGYSVFDFGRSKKGTGAYSFKKNWGFEPQDLHYQYFLIEADSMPNVSPSNPKYRLFINAWKRMPLSLSKMIGPHLSKYLG